MQTNAVVLNPAAEPTEHSRPKVFLNVLVSIFLGTLLGVGAALMLELGNRRVRSAEDLSEALGIPVLATISSIQSTAKRSFFSPRRKPASAACPLTRPRSRHESTPGPRLLQTAQGRHPLHRRHPDRRRTAHRRRRGKILRVQKEQGRRFGDAAIGLGLLTEDDIRFALARQFDYPTCQPATPA